MSSSQAILSYSYRLIAVSVTLLQPAESGSATIDFQLVMSTYASAVEMTCAETEAGPRELCATPPPFPRQASSLSLINADRGAAKALGGATTRKDLHINWSAGHFLFDGFSIPFFLAALFMLFALGIGALWLANSSFSHPAPEDEEKKHGRGWIAHRAIRLTLGLTAGGLAVRFLSKLLQPLHQIVIGFMLMGVGLLILPFVQPSLVLLAVGLIGFGMALVSPNLAAQISRLAGNRQGESLGWQSAAESTGKVAGPLVGSLLFSLYARLPYVLAGAFVFGVGALAALLKSSKLRSERNADG